MPKSVPTEAEKVAKLAEKHTKFVELATKRVNKVLEALRGVRQLANKTNYEFSAEEAKAVNDALGAAVDNVEDAFQSALEGKKAKVDGFSFGG